MAKDVKVTIDIAKAASNTGFGYPLIFEGKAKTPIAYTECSSIDDVIKAVGGITASDNESTVASKTTAAKASNIYKAALLLFMQDNAPGKIAVCASAEEVTAALPGISHFGWRQIVVVSTAAEGESSRKDISDFVETTDKMYFTSVESPEDISMKGNDRTVVMVHKDDDPTIVFPEAALVGATAGKAAGSFTYKNIVLKGLTPKILPESEFTAIRNANAIAFVLKRGKGVTSDGITAGGEYIDVIDSQDYIIQNIEGNIQELLINSDKLTYDNPGISQLETVTASVLKDAADNSMIALDDSGTPDYSVSFLPRSETKPADRQARRYTGGSFRFTLAGAIHTAEIVGSIEI